MHAHVHDFLVVLDMIATPTATLLLLLDLLQGWYPTLSDYTYFGVFGHLVIHTRDMTCLGCKIS